MPVFQDITGQRFGRLVVMRFSRMAPGGSRWVCCCDCNGNEIVVRVSHLTSGKTKSCGCLGVEMIRDRNTRHGYAPRNRRPSIYKRWATMMQRCYNPNSTAYKYYGACGVIVYDYWHDPKNFIIDILASIGEPPPKRVLDRIDNDGNYEPGNVRWATLSESNKNRGPSVWQTRERTSDGRFT